MDNSDKIIEDLKWTLFSDRLYELSLSFISWAGDNRSFIVEDDDGQEYRITVTKEIH